MDFFLSNKNCEDFSIFVYFELHSNQTFFVHHQTLLEHWNNILVRLHHKVKVYPKVKQYQMVRELLQQKVYQRVERNQEMVMGNMK